MTSPWKPPTLAETKRAEIISWLSMIDGNLFEAEDGLVGAHPGDEPRVEWALHNVRQAQQEMEKVFALLDVDKKDLDQG